jgi:excisionase family DNA binding protein
MEKRSRTEALVISKTEAAQLLACSQQFIEKLIDNGELPIVKLGRKMVRVRMTDLMGLLERRVEVKGTVAA